MPKLHPITGLAACGTAGGRVSFGGRSGEANELTDGGCTFWLNADEIAYLGPVSGSWGGVPGRTAPQAVNIHTGARRPLEAVPAGVALREASFLAAAGGRWQAAQAGQGATFGSCGEFPGGTISRGTTDSRGAAAADGSIILLDSYQGSGNGFRISRPDGVIVPTFNPPEDRQPGIGAGAPDRYHMTLIDASRAIWPEAGQWGTYGLPAPLWLPGSLRACYVEIAGVAYLVHWLESRGLVARRADSSRGKILTAADREFHYDAIAWNGGIRIAWATIEGEPPGSLEIVEWDLVSGLEELGEIIIPPKPIGVTITASPTSGTAPLTVHALATIVNGPATTIAWRYRLRGSSDWRVAVVNPGADTDHSFRFVEPGEYEISAAVEGPNGRSESTLTRVTATKAEPPNPPASLYYSAKEYAMSASEEIGAIKIADRFARIVLAGDGRGPFGWFAVDFELTTPDDDCWFTLSKPDTRHALIHTKIPVLLGADQKQAEDPFFYGKPTNLPNARGILESPVVIKDPASNLIVVYWTWPDRHPSGGTSSPSATWIKRAS